MATHCPRLTPGLHAQYVEIVTSHVEHDLGRHLASVSGGPAWASADLWAALAQACRRAALDGRCDARRVQLLHQLAAVEDFVAFFEMMSQPVPLQLEPVDGPQP